MTDAMTIGIVGARGHTGVELIRLIERHPALDLAFVSSRELEGQSVREHIEGFAGEMRFVNFAPGAVAAQRVDALILALPNGNAGEFVAAVDASKPDTVIIDLSADHRFRDDWYYGLPELTRTRYAQQRRISNPGCYATAMQLAIAPLKRDLVAPPTCFGVSGYSGAGTTASDRNDLDKLRDNLMPYSLVDHVHERETTRQLGVPVEFMPHVAAHFRGIMVTLNLWLQQATNAAALKTRFREFYANEPLVRIIDDAPWVSAIAGKHHVEIGGFAVAAGGKRVVLVATIDNLLKGAATQAIQNINIAFGFDEYTSIPDVRHPGAGQDPSDLGAKGKMDDQPAAVEKRFRPRPK